MVPDTGKQDGPAGRLKGARMDDEVRRSMARIGEATDRLLASAATLTDASAGEPSPLPGWTRGHVLTHIARNGDGLGNLLRWARTGVKTPMYASREARQADIEAGAGRSAADLTADVQATAISFAAEAASLPGQAWAAEVQMLVGPPMPARRVLDWRLREVEIHHVDLAAGYRPADWPREFVAGNLPEIAGSFAGRDDAPTCLLQPDGSDSAWRVGPDRGGAPPVSVHGPAATLLAWLIGRDDGSGLRVSGEDAVLPVLPSWR
jgi:maleylpyruvate isomerase